LAYIGINPTEIIGIKLNDFNNVAILRKEIKINKNEFKEKYFEFKIKLPNYNCEGKMQQCPICQDNMYLETKKYGDCQVGSLRN